MDARTTVGLYYQQVYQFAHAHETVAPILDLAVALDYRKRLPSIYTIVGVHHAYDEGDFPKALHYLEEAVHLAEVGREPASLFFSHFWLGSVLLHLCRLDESLHHTQKALAINEAAQSRWGVAAVRSSLSVIYCLQGRVRQAYEETRAAVALAEESGDAYSRGFAYTYHGVSSFAMGHFQEAMDCLSKAHALCARVRSYGNQVYAQTHMGDVFLEEGHYTQAKTQYLQAIDLIERTRASLMHLASAKFSAALSRAMNGEKDIELPALYRLEARNADKMYEGPLARNLAWILLQGEESDRRQAESWIQKAIRADEVNGMRWALAGDYVAYAEFYEKGGDRSRAREQHAKAIELYRQCGADGWVTRTEEKLARL